MKTERAKKDGRSAEGGLLAEMRARIGKSLLFWGLAAILALSAFTVLRRETGSMRRTADTAASGEAGYAEPEGNPGQDSGEDWKGNPGQGSGEDRKGNPGQSSGEDQKGNSGQNSGEDQKENPGQGSGEDQKENPGQNSREDQNENPGQDSGEDQKENPGQNSREDQKENPGQGSGEDLKENPVQGSGEESESGERKRVALTFDDGPHPSYTAELLDGLKERGVKATFFVIGKNIPGNEDVIRRMADEGHLIGNHTYDHVKISDMDSAAACEQIEKTSRLVRELTGKDTEFVRPPFGEWNRELECPLVMIPVLWDVDPKDWTTRNSSEVVRRVLEDTGDGDIILLHDYYRSSVEAALEIVDRLQEQGYEFVTVDELVLE